MSTINKEEVIKDNGLHDKDTGSTDVQIAVLTERINALTEHLKTAKKDLSSRRGLINLVNRRRRLLDYLARTKSDRYEALIKKLKLRR